MLLCHWTITSVSPLPPNIRGAHRANNRTSGGLILQSRAHTHLHANVHAYLNTLTYFLSLDLTKNTFLYLLPSKGLSTCLDDILALSLQPHVEIGALMDFTCLEKRGEKQCIKEEHAPTHPTYMYSVSFSDLFILIVVYVHFKTAEVHCHWSGGTLCPLWHHKGFISRVEWYPSCLNLRPAVCNLSGQKAVLFMCSFFFLLMTIWSVPSITQKILYCLNILKTLDRQIINGANGSYWSLLLATCAQVLINNELKEWNRCQTFHWPFIICL